jgi:hypothetical protein
LCQITAIICSNLPNLSVIPTLHALKCLKIVKCNNLVVISEMPTLCVLEIDECHEIKSLPYLPALKTIKLFFCFGIRHLSSFLKVSKLELNTMDRLRSIPKMPSLSELSIFSRQGLCFPLFPNIKKAKGTLCYNHRREIMVADVVALQWITLYVSRTYPKFSSDLLQMINAMFCHKPKARS